MSTRLAPVPLGLARLSGHDHSRSRGRLGEAMLGLNVGLDPGQRPATETLAKGSGEPIEQAGLDQPDGGPLFTDDQRRPGALLSLNHPDGPGSGNPGSRCTRCGDLLDFLDFLDFFDLFAGLDFTDPGRAAHAAQPQAAPGGFASANSSSSSTSSSMTSRTTRRGCRPLDDDHFARHGRGLTRRTTRRRTGRWTLTSRGGAGGASGSRPPAGGADHHGTVPRAFPAGRTGRA